MVSRHWSIKHTFGAARQEVGLDNCEVRNAADCMDCHAPGLKPREQDRSGALLLSVARMRSAQMAAHFGCCQATGRHWLHQFAAAGLKFPRHR